jgi:hypothetical protein
VDTEVLEEHASSIFRVEVISVRMWPGYIGKMDEITQYWDGRSPMWVTGSFKNT